MFETQEPLAIRISPQGFWESVPVDSEHRQQVVLSWFKGALDDMKVESAELCCSYVTRRAAGYRAVLITADGKRMRAQRMIEDIVMMEAA